MLRGGGGSGREDAVRCYFLSTFLPFLLVLSFRISARSDKSVTIW